ncbi:hypothetical protein [Streptomyces sp. NPDC014623]|uniref:hypothetical protein n=1 Tax=Streptomyces sp. NPDC014623 TaxID=3364875 RepID=UPI0036FDE528
MRRLTGLAANSGMRSARSSTGPTSPPGGAEAAEHSCGKLSPDYDEALATERDEQRRRDPRETRDWMAAGDPVDAQDSSMRSYDAALAELSALLGLLNEENLRVRTRAAYLLAWFPEPADISVPLLPDLAAREHDGVAEATSLMAAGILGTPALAPALATEPDAEDALVRWAAATAIAQSARSADAADHSLLERAVAEFAAAAAAPAPVLVTDYDDGDFRGLSADILIALPPSAASRAAVAACLPSIGPSQTLFKAKAVLPALFPAPLPSPRARVSIAPGNSRCAPSPPSPKGGGTPRRASAKPSPPTDFRPLR